MTSARPAAPLRTSGRDEGAVTDERFPAVGYLEAEAAKDRGGLLERDRRRRGRARCRPSRNSTIDGTGTCPRTSSGAA